MTFDYKKEYKEFYLPGKKPQLVEIPKMNYIAVRGKGNPNEEGGAYKESIGLLYGIAFTIKMSKKSSHEIQGYFDYVVPPLEGFWQQDGIEGIDYEKKEFRWISVIRLPDFVKKTDFDWAIREAEEKKKQDFSKAVLSSKLPSTSFQLFRQNKNTPGTKKFDVFSITLFAAWGFCGIISFCNMKTGRNPTDQSFVPAHNHRRLSPHGHLL